MSPTSEQCSSPPPAKRMKLNDAEDITLESLPKEILALISTYLLRGSDALYFSLSCRFIRTAVFDTHPLFVAETEMKNTLNSLEQILKRSTGNLDHQTGILLRDHMQRKLQQLISPEVEDDFDEAEIYGIEYLDPFELPPHPDPSDFPEFYEDLYDAYDDENPVGWEDAYFDHTDEGDWV